MLAGWSLLYKYTADLLCLDFCRPSRPLDPRLPVLSAVKTPLNVAAWRSALSSHPDPALARYICQGLEQGFRVGFQRGSPLKSAARNLVSASLHPEAVNEFIAKELSLGRLLGPFQEDTELPQLHINRIGVVPKGHNAGKWRIITDLSFPHGQSVNDGIDPSFCSLCYTTVDEVAARVAHLGRGTLLAKIDIESAYRLLPVHPHDRPLQAIKWNNQIYVDAVCLLGCGQQQRFLTQ